MLPLSYRGTKTTHSRCHKLTAAAHIDGDKPTFRKPILVIERCSGYCSGINAGGLDGIDLLGYLHGTQFSADASPYPAADNQAGHEGAGFVDDRVDESGGKHGLGSESNQAAPAFQGEHGADGGTRQGYQGQGFGTYFVKLTKQLATFKGAAYCGAHHLPRKKAEIAKPLEEAVDQTPDGSDRRSHE